MNMVVMNAKEVRLICWALKTPQIQIYLHVYMSVWIIK